MSTFPPPNPLAGPAAPGPGGAPDTAPVTALIGWPNAQRQVAFEEWIADLAPTLGLRLESLAPASADASFRRYFRVQAEGCSWVVMDAPPPLEDVRPFVRLAAMLGQAGLNVPRVLHADPDQGFLLLSDLGEQVYLRALTEATPAQADALMLDALKALLHFQQHVSATELPAFDEALLREELALFPRWCVQREFGVQWSAAQQAAWDGICDKLVASALAQPQVAVHADWMPRNLMVCPADQGNPGILDFQDAVRGPITYDLASLLRDAFISWDETQELDWAVRWWQQARAAGLPLNETMAADFGEFWRALEWMGLQRHLKVMGIFCRLKHRDGKPHYAVDLPRFLAYAQKVALRYGPLRPLLTLLEPLSGARVTAGYTF